MGLIEHIRTQSTAIDHALLGAVGAILFAAGAVGILTGNILLVLFMLLACAVGGFITGIGIEAAQYIQRIGRAQNPFREMVLDALMTGAWPLTLWLRRKDK